jgi:hypothetical protein
LTFSKIYKEKLRQCILIIHYLNLIPHSHTQKNTIPQIKKIIITITIIVTTQQQQADFIEEKLMIESKVASKEENQYQFTFSTDCTTNEGEIE